MRGIMLGTVQIIGGADGPTSIFIAGRLGDPWTKILFPAALCLGILAAVLIWRGKVSQRRRRAAVMLEILGCLCFGVKLGFLAYELLGGFTNVMKVSDAMAGFFAFLFLVLAGTRIRRGYKGQKL